MVKWTNETEIKKKHIANAETYGSITVEYFFHSCWNTEFEEGKTYYFDSVSGM